MFEELLRGEDFRPLMTDRQIALSDNPTLAKRLIDLEKEIQNARLETRRNWESKLAKELTKEDFHLPISVAKYAAKHSLSKTTAKEKCDKICKMLDEIQELDS